MYIAKLYLGIKAELRMRHSLFKADCVCYSSKNLYIYQKNFIS